MTDLSTASLGRTLIPTMQLRFLARHTGLQTQFILQQAFQGPDGIEWHRVPSVDEEQSK